MYLKNVHVPSDSSNINELFIYLMKATNISFLNKLAAFIFSAFKKRNS